MHKQVIANWHYNGKKGSMKWSFQLGLGARYLLFTFSDPHLILPHPALWPRRPINMICVKGSLLFLSYSCWFPFRKFKGWKRVRLGYLLSSTLFQQRGKFGGCMLAASHQQPPFLWVQVAVPLRRERTDGSPCFTLGVLITLSSVVSPHPAHIFINILKYQSLLKLPTLNELFPAWRWLTQVNQERIHREMSWRGLTRRLEEKRKSCTRKNTCKVRKRDCKAYLVSRS